MPDLSASVLAKLKNKAEKIIASSQILCDKHIVVCECMNYTKNKK